MTVQMSVIFSDHFVGTGIVAGGPYYCVAGNDANIPMCTGGIPKPKRLNASKPYGINDKNLIKFTDVFAQKSLVSHPEYLKDMPVWIYSATSDSIVVPGVVNETY
jgi:hypothetical protein